MYCVCFRPHGARRSVRTYIVTRVCSIVLAGQYASFQRAAGRARVSLFGYLWYLQTSGGPVYGLIWLLIVPASVSPGEPVCELIAPLTRRNREKRMN